jgi:ABC-type Fe3+/spermidine/putrescine transport system ATPase subunit
VSEPVLELTGVVKHYGPTLGVGPIDFAVESGEFLTLLGPSGCGKTTTLHLIAGLLAPDEGRLVLAGRDISLLPPSRRDMGLVFQNYALFPHKTVFDNVSFGLRMRRVPREAIARRVRAMLEVVGLQGVEGRYPHQLSGGQRQRVALARALVIEPTALLLDEPLSNLDALLRKRMRRELRAIQKRLRTTTIYVTHDQEEAFEMSDRVVLLNHGRILQIGPPEELYDRPATRFVAEFIGEANLLPGTLAAIEAGGATVRIAGGALLPVALARADLRPGDAVYAVVRPEQLGLARERPATDALSAKVIDRIFAGDTVRITLATDDGTELASTKPSLPEFRAVSPGDRVWVVPARCLAVRRED